MTTILKRVLILLGLLLLAAAAATYFHAEETKDPGPPPDLTGRWVQVGATPESDWYFYADITDDVIEIWWYLPSWDESALYWHGTFTPPENGWTPYSWTSVNDMERARTSQRASREAEKTFTYKDDGRLSYVVTAGHLQMGYALERADGSAVRDQLPPAEG